MENLPPRKEKFCQLVASGTKYSDAYVIAGYKNNNVPQNAHHLYHQEAVQQRINEIIKEQQRELRKLYIFDKERILLELGKIVYSPMAKDRDKIFAIQVMSKLLGLEINLNAYLNFDAKSPENMDMSELRTYLARLKENNVK